MTAPVPTLTPRTAPRTASREAATGAPGAPGASTPQDKPAGFAAHLAEETPRAEDAERAITAEPPQIAADVANAGNTPAPAEAPGKTLPPVRQKAAPLLAATGLLIGMKGAHAAPPEADGAPTAPDDLPESETPGTAAAVLTTAAQLGPSLAGLLATAPTAAPAPSVPPAPASPAAQQPPVAVGAAAALPGTGAGKGSESGPGVAASPTQPGAGDPAQAQAAPAARHGALAFANLVLERDSEAAPTDARPPAAGASPETPPTAAQLAARAQPSTVAAVAGQPDRAPARKQRSETDSPLAASKSGAGSAGLADTAATLAFGQMAPTGGAPTPAAVPTAPTAPADAGAQPFSFDQLVDSIARARDGLDPDKPVAVALRHSEFGRVSLRIESDASGMSVAMASPDPGFAPAVAAAHAAAALPEPVRMAPSASRMEASGQSLAQGQGQPGTGQQRPAQRPAANPARPPASTTERRGGIFA